MRFINAYCIGNPYILQVFFAPRGWNFGRRDLVDSRIGDHVKNISVIHWYTRIKKQRFWNEMKKIS